jgi:hypothetical protein
MELIGWLLIAAGLLEPVVGVLLVGPRIPDERRRLMLHVALITSGMLMVGLGVAFLLGLFEGAVAGA